MTIFQAAETGSGKTGAFCLPVIQIVYETLKDLEEGRSVAKKNRFSSSGAVGGAQVRMSVFDRTDAFAVDSTGLLCQSRDCQGWHGARANKGVSDSGRYYYEVSL